MRIPILPSIVALIINILIDWLIYQSFRSSKFRKIHVAISAIVNVFWIVLTCMPKKSGGDDDLTFMMWGLFIFLSIFFAKVSYTLFELLRKILIRIFKRRFVGLKHFAGLFAATMLAAMWWGAFVTRYSTNIERIEVKVKGLPETFDGFKLAHISDIHAGTFGKDSTFLNKVVNEINALNVDAIVFSGDIINRHSSELAPFTNTLSRLKALQGVWSVMGNHDYGDYYHWSSPAEKDADINKLKTMQKDMGWQMLNDSYAWLRRGNDSIAIVGVENIGDPPFHVYGSLDRAYHSISDNNTKILVSHNPVHWTDSIADKKDINIALTLSGHTHAMQCEIFGLSPAAMRYKTWCGLYTDSLGRALYVNTGIGTVGFPSRIGATPEITLITLKAE